MIADGTTHEFEKNLLTGGGKFHPVVFHPVVCYGILLQLSMPEVSGDLL